QEDTQLCGACAPTENYGSPYLSLDQLARWDYRCTRALASNAWWEAFPTKVPSLLDCCRLKLEQMVLLGQVTILQLSPLVEHYIARLPRRHAARFVTSLFAKSITHWFPCKSLLGKIHTFVPYSTLQHATLDCDVDDTHKFNFPVRQDGYFCAQCHVIACSDHLRECVGCGDMVCDECGAQSWEAMVPDYTREEWIDAGRPTPIPTTCQEDVYGWVVEETNNTQE
ncbi:uncharacterized protein ACA1_071080, partial [Acanthamoeba castellanii str. Neff]